MNLRNDQPCELDRMTTVPSYLQPLEPGRPTEFLDPREPHLSAHDAIGDELRWHDPSARLDNTKSHDTLAEGGVSEDARVENGPINENQPLWGARKVDPSEVEAANAAETEALVRLFSVKVSAGIPLEFIKAVALNACAFELELPSSDEALWQAKEVYSRIQDDNALRKLVIEPVHETHARNPELSNFYHMFILQCAELYEKVLGTLWAPIPGGVLLTFEWAEGYLYEQGYLGFERNVIYQRRAILLSRMAPPYDTLEDLDLWPEDDEAG